MIGHWRLRFYQIKYRINLTAHTVNIMIEPNMRETGCVLILILRSGFRNYCDANKDFIH